MDSATVPVHRAVIDPKVFVTLAEVGIKNKCYELSMDASEDVVSLVGTMDDLLIKVVGSRYMRALEKGPTHVRTYDFSPEDIVVCHYHCGIAPEPSAIDLESMRLAVRAQLVATVPGRPRVFGIISPTIAGSSFCINLNLYEPVPLAFINYDVSQLKIKNLDEVERLRKGFAIIEEEGGTYYLEEPCEGLEEGCYPVRFGSSPDIVLEDFIFILSYPIHPKLKRFPYAKVSPAKALTYEVEVINVDLERIVVRGLVWKALGGSTKGLQNT